MSHSIVILGAGISGLATAWYLKQILDVDASIHIIERDQRAGGWVQTAKSDEFLFEQGPRSCRSKGGGRETLALIEHLGLQDQVLIPHANATRRFLFDKGGLQRVPKHLWELPFHALTKGWIKALWNDWRNPCRTEPDESIHSFFSRRLGSDWADRFIDPFVLGIYAGDCKRLSMKSCFPLFDEWERAKGSLLRGAFFHKKSKSHTSAFIDEICRFPLFSFKHGMETLPRALALELKDQLQLGKGAKQLIGSGSQMEVHLDNGECLLADTVISTLPVYALADLFPAGLEVQSTLRSLNYATVALVNMGFDAPILPGHGFGYLVPTRMRELVLGCIWDSSVFPSQNVRSSQTRLTFMLGGSHHPEMEEMGDKEIVECALRACRKQMGILPSPSKIQLKKTKQAIPQFAVNHEGWKKEVEDRLKVIYPSLILSGTAWSGVSINDCIGGARRLAERLAHAIDHTD